MILPNQIEAEIAVDYMAQAENLLEEGQRGKFDHVPAAVLAGAVLEKALRTLATRQGPQVPTTGQKGRPVRLNALIDSHRKTGTYNEATAKQLRAWADIRNHAAHGEFEQFSRSDVELMIKGINAFLATIWLEMVNLNRLHGDIVCLFLFQFSTHKLGGWQNNPPANSWSDGFGGQGAVRIS